MDTTVDKGQCPLCLWCELCGLYVARWSSKCGDDRHSRRPSGGQVVCQYLMLRPLQQVAGPRDACVCPTVGETEGTKDLETEKSAWPCETYRTDN
jgi:hypothetical protein